MKFKQFSESGNKITHHLIPEIIILLIAFDIFQSFSEYLTY